MCLEIEKNNKTVLSAFEVTSHTKNQVSNVTVDFINVKEAVDEASKPNISTTLK